MEGAGLYAALQTTMSSYEESQSNRDSDFRLFMCSLLPGATFMDLIWYILEIVSNGENLYEKQFPIFWEN